MASAIIFLVCACALLPLLAAWKDSPCVFPFIYRGESYSSCTGAGTRDGQLWCATTPNYDQDYKWKWCATQEYGGNSEGKPCEFPFKYLGKTYYICTTKHSKKPWCATTGSYDRDRKWSHCADTRQSGDPCVFPFMYKNVTRTTCMTEDSPDGEPWCSATKNYDVDHRRVPCNASEPSACTFPFLYNGKLYCSCTTDGTGDKQLWCATTPNYDRDRTWRTCVLQDYGGNSNGNPCWFPFVYKEEIHHNCTSADEPSGRPWCATTRSYDQDAEWTFCADPAPPEEAAYHNRTCVFPFIYNGKQYSACTTHGSAWGMRWCSLTSNYDLDHKWTYCDDSDRERGCSQQS